MGNVLRWTVIVVLLAHGLIHLLGVAKGFGLADVPQPKGAIDVRSGLPATHTTLLATSSLNRAVDVYRCCWTSRPCGHRAGPDLLV